jgi:hypothetical protein
MKLHPGARLHRIRNTSELQAGDNASGGVAQRITHRFFQSHSVNHCANMLSIVQNTESFLDTGLRSNNVENDRQTETETTYTCTLFKQMPCQKQEL